MKYDKLVTFWSKRERDFMTRYPGYKADAHLVHQLFSVPRREGEVSFVEELEKRGYDTTTLRFSVKRRVPAEGEK